jgi:DNA invertase Pin-like site-specific DNA recombinase
VGHECDQSVLLCTFGFSTIDQRVDNQQRELLQVSKRNAWQVVSTFTDNGISGAKGRRDRAGYDGLLKSITRREVDLVAAWSVDRLGRSLTDLLHFLGEIHSKGCDLYLHQQGLDTSTGNWVVLPSAWMWKIKSGRLDALVLAFRK